MSQKIFLRITGMTCAHCAHSVEKALLGIHGVDSAQVSLATNQAEVVLQSSILSISAMDWPHLNAKQHHI